MAEFNPNIFATAPGALAARAPTFGPLQKRAREALVDNGYSPVPDASGNYAYGSGTGEVTTTNFPATKTYAVVPYVLRYMDENGAEVSETKNWTDHIPVNTLVMVRAANTANVISGHATPPVMLTLPQLNYQLHLSMRGKLIPHVTTLAAALVAAAGNADAITRANRQFHNSMLGVWKSVMNEALTWCPAGVLQTAPDKMPVMRNPVQHHKVVQTGGTAWIQNIWNNSITCGSSLWLKLGASWRDPRQYTSYVLYEKEIVSVPPLDCSNWVLVPRFEALACTAGYSLNPEYTGIDMYTEPVSARPDRYNKMRQAAELYRIGVCFDVSGMKRGARQLAGITLPPQEVSVYEPPGLSNQLQIVLSGDL